MITARTVIYDKNMHLSHCNRSVPSLLPMLVVHSDIFTPSFKHYCGYFFFQAEDGIRDTSVTGVQTCALPICSFLAKQCRPKLRVSNGGRRDRLTIHESSEEFTVPLGDEQFHQNRGVEIHELFPATRWCSQLPSSLQSRRQNGESRFYAGPSSSPRCAGRRYPRRPVVHPAVCSGMQGRCLHGLYQERPSRSSRMISSADFAPALDFSECKSAQSTRKGLRVDLNGTSFAFGWPSLVMITSLPRAACSRRLDSWSLAARTLTSIDEGGSNIAASFNN